MPHADSSFLPAEVTTKAQLWAHIYEQLELLIEGQRQWVSNLANASSLIYHSLASFPEFGPGDSAVNWAGFYISSDLFPNASPQISTPTLLLGPFSGRPACQFIKAQAGKGVCADAYVTRRTVLVRDVHSYPGHIACDGETKSEIVVPVFDGGDEGEEEGGEGEGKGKVVGVLDLDCLKLGGFDEVDQEGVERIAGLLGRGCDW